MLGPIDERTPPMTPQLALRVAIIGGIALVMFAMIFFRLWFLQVLSGNQYVAQAQSNPSRDMPVAAPRGEIVDSTGNPLVESVAGPVDPDRAAQPAGPGRTRRRTNLPVVIPRRRTTRCTTGSRELLRISTKPHRCSYTVYWNDGPGKYDDAAGADPLPGRREHVAGCRTPTSRSRPTSRPDIQDYLAERQLQFPGVAPAGHLHPQVPARHRRRAAVRTLGPLTPEAEEQALQGRRAGRHRRSVRPRVPVQPVPAGRRRQERVKVNAQASSRATARRPSADPGDTLKLSLERAAREGRRSRRWRSRSRNRRRPAARSSR